MEGRRASAYVLLVCALVSGFAHAQSEPPPEGMDLLEMVFGVDPSTFATLLEAPRNSLLATLSFTANVLAALIAALFFLYHGVIFAIRAATRGEADSQKDGVWVFSRGAVALMFCAPLAGGYSFLQVVLMWLAGLGSFVADTAWSEMKSEMQTSPAAVGAGVWLDRMVATEFDTRLSDTLAQSMTCLATAKQVYANYPEVRADIHENESRVVMDLFKPAGVLHSWSFGGTGGDGDLPRGVCGNVALMLPVPGVGQWETQHQGYEYLRAALPDAVKRYQNGVLSAAFEATGEHRIEVGEAFARAEQAFRRDLMTAVRGAYAASTPMADQLFNSTLLRIEDAGWVGAGVTYLAAAQYERSVANLATMPFTALTVEGPSGFLRMPMELHAEYATYRDKVMASIQQRRDSKFGAGDTSMWEIVKGCFGMGDKDCVDGPARLVWQWTRDFLTTLTQGQNQDGGDPLAAAQRYGQNIFGSSLVLLSGGAGFNMASDYVSEATPNNPVSGFGSVGLGAVGSVLVAVGWALLSVGIMLGFYIPMLPMILWATGVVIWLVTVAQMVVTTPIWAVMHAAGEGEGLAGNRAQLGYQIAFALFVRPILMLAGLFAGLLIARVGMGVAGYMFSIFGDTMMDDVSNPLAGVVIAVIMAVSLVALARFAFSLIYTLPDWAQRLLGAHEFGEGMQEQSLRSAVAGLSGEIRSFAQGAKFKGNSASREAGLKRNLANEEAKRRRG